MLHPIEIKFLGAEELTVQATAGTRLMNVCDEFNAPLLFGCRSASCGTCLIEVVDGHENLSPITDEEEIIIDVMAEGNPSARLGCQCTVNGPIVIRPLEG